MSNYTVDDLKEILQDSDAMTVPTVDQVFNFQLAPEDMKLLDSLNENLQTVVLG